MQLEKPLVRQTPVRFGELLRLRLNICASLALALFAGSSAVWGAPQTKAAARTAQNRAAALPLFPLRFEQDERGRWSARGAGYAIAFEDSALDLRVPDGMLRLTFEGAAGAATFEPSEKAAAPTNYFRGHTFRSADAFGRLRRRSLYPGVDVVYYGAGGKLEYDFDLAPGADPSQIRMRFEGAGAASLDASGNVVLKLGAGEIVQQLPSVYQTRRSGERVAVKASYQLAADGSIGLGLASYDRSQPLVIDPAVLFDFWLTGSNAQTAIALGHDAKGYEYMAGFTYSPDFSAGGNGYDHNYHSDEDCWLLKFNPFPNGGPVVVYSTYFGGQLDDDLRSMVVDSNGVMYFGGTSLSPDLPMSANAYQSTLPNTNALLNGFVAAIDTNQSGSAGLIYSSYFGGTMETVVNGVAARGGQIYATGRTLTTDLPLVSAVQPANNGSYDAFLAVFNPSAATASGTLAFSTYLGGAQQDAGRSVDADSSGRAYVTGYTYSSDFPVAGNAFQQIYNDGGGDAFVTIIDPVAGALVYSSFLGGTGGDVGVKIQVEPSGHVAVGGYTFSTDFPVSVQAAQPYYGGNGDAFIAVLDPSAANQAEALVYGTFYGGSDSEVAYDLRRDPQGLYYVAGYTLSKDLPVTANALFPASAGGGIDSFTAIIDPNTSFTYASYITGPGNQVAHAVDYDASGNIYSAGYATGDIFPNGAPPHATPGEYDVFFLLVSPH